MTLAEMLSILTNGQVTAYFAQIIQTLMDFCCKEALHRPLAKTLGSKSKSARVSDVNQRMKLQSTFQIYRFKAGTSNKASILTFMDRV